MQGLNVTKPGGNRAPSETVLNSTHLEQLQMQGNQFISTPHDVQLISEAAKLAAIDALLYVAEHTPAGFRSLRREEITPISTPWPEYVVDLAGGFGVDAVVANIGAFLIEENTYVCHADDLKRGIEEGWNCVKLPSIDGRVRPESARAPCILVSPDECSFLWHPNGHGLHDQRYVTFKELCDLLGDIGERLARFKKVAAL